MRRWIAVALGVLLPVHVAAAPLDEFARCLTAEGVTYYFTTWCPHCQRQQALFGRAFRHLRAVDCTDGCPGVSSFPTWTFRDGSRLTGFRSPEVLATRTRCPLGGSTEPPDTGGDTDPAADPTLDSAGDGTHVRHLGGAKFIEVPRR
jgi:hypothetical protein